jgi:hypothetical protein
VSEGVDSTKAYGLGAYTLHMGVEFNEPTFASPRSAVSQADPSSFEKFIIKTGLVKSRDGARLVLIGISLVLLVGAAFLFVRSSSIPPPPNPADYPVWPH